MEIDFYQTESRKTAIYPNQGQNWVYPVFGLCGESGEIAEKCKKVLRDSNGIMTDEKRREISKELGDVCWYVSQLSTELGFSLSQILQDNLDKLKSRQERGVLKGSGDNR